MSYPWWIRPWMGQGFETMIPRQTLDYAYNTIPGGNPRAVAGSIRFDLECMAPRQYPTQTYYQACLANGYSRQDAITMNAFYKECNPYMHAPY